jgi:glycosyltransferase involved in cell wall biosynthesis
VDQVAGGGELVNEEVIRRLGAHKYSVERRRSQDVTLQFIEDNKDCFFIVGNFIALSEECKEFLKDKRYAIYEHDHKYLTTRDPSRFSDYFAPNEYIINKDFYSSAAAVLCQSAIHSEVVVKNLLLDNVVNLGCSLWEPGTMDYIEELSSTPKVNKVAVLESTNPIKGTMEAMAYCDQQNISYNLIGSPNYREFLADLATYETLVFFPRTLETFCRFAVEARMLGCKVITNEKIGAISQNWFNKKGLDLISLIRKEQEEPINALVNIIEGKSVSFVVAPKIPKVSIVTSLYKAGKYLDHFLSEMTQQTIFDQCELILINANSPDNEGEIVAPYLKKHSNIVYKELEDDPGVYGVWNMGIELSTGEYITNANVDDIRHHSQIEILARELVNHREVDLVYSTCLVTTQSNESFTNNSSNDRVYPVQSFTKENMIKCLPGCMPLWRRTMHTNAGMFDRSYRHAGDWEMWLRAVRAGSTFKKVSGVHGLYYYNPDGLSTADQHNTDRFNEEKRIFTEYKDVFGQKITSQYQSYFSQGEG